MKTNQSIDTLRAIIDRNKASKATKMKEVDRTQGVVAAIKYLIKKGVLTNRPG
jgi:hypothetical protein